MGTKVKIHWWEDAQGKQTCHLNLEKLTAEQTYVGEIFFFEDSWCSRLKDYDTIRKHPNWRHAKKFVEDSVDGEPLDAWD